ncbi:MAG TPA: tetratricopeptide repeat protein [Vicinamibacterales bacterium]|nr:tetratricopeptide repeat protein [Vicinamibacterales bacterium]
MASLAIFLVALTVRLVHVWQIRKAPFFDVLMGDARGYDEWARRIAGGEWIGRDVFYQAPLYPYFLGIIYRVAGHSLLAVRVCQAAIGSASCVLLGTAARRLFSPAVGLAAGLMLALYAPAIFFDGLLQKSVLDVFFVCAALYCIARIALGRTSDWIYLGMAIGALSLTRENALVFVLVLAVWAFLRGRMRALAIFVAGVALVLAPVAIRNAAVGGGFYLTTSQFGPNFYIGNHPGADGSYESLKYGRGAPEYERQDATDLAQLAAGHPLTPGEVSSYWTERALDFVTGQPAAWLKLMGRKFVLLWNRTEMIDTEDQSTHGEWSWPLRVLGPIGTFGILVPLALVGAIVTWRDRTRLFVLYALIACYAASVLAFYVFARYRYPLVPLLILFAAAGVVGIRDASVRSRVIGVRVLAAAVVVVIFCNWPVASAADMRAVTDTNLGAALQDEGRVDEAIAQYRRAIAERPDYAPAYNNLATALRKAGKRDEARAAYERALALQPDFASAHFNLANLLLDEGKTAEAAAHFERAAGEEPASADVHNNFGIALASAGKIDDAIREFRAAVTIDPGSAKAYRNLGDVLSTAGRADEAIDALQTAVKLDPNDPANRYDLASTLLDAHRLDAAVGEFRATIALSPRYAEAHNNLGIALGSMGRLDEAIAEFRRALEIDPGLASARQNLAMVTKAKR